MSINSGMVSVSVTGEKLTSEDLLELKVHLAQVIDYLSRNPAKLPVTVEMKLPLEDRS